MAWGKTVKRCPFLFAFFIFNFLLSILHHRLINYLQDFGCRNYNSNTHVKLFFVKMGMCYSQEIIDSIGNNKAGKMRADFSHYTLRIKQSADDQA